MENFEEDRGVLETHIFEFGKKFVWVYLHCTRYPQMGILKFNRRIKEPFIKQLSKTRRSTKRVTGQKIFLVKGEATKFLDCSIG